MQYDCENLLQNMYDGLYLVDTNRRITYWNKAAEKISGYPAHEVIGSRCSDNVLIHVDGKGSNLCFGGCPLAATIEDGVPREAELYLHHKEGHRVPVWIRVTVLRDTNGTIVGGAELFTDLSSREAVKLRVEELEKLAFLDELTQLANRRYIELELMGRFAEKKRYGLSFGILLMDIDHFKQVNDTYGHPVGDIVLKEVAKTLVNTGRSFDLFGRWGGEEFIGIFRNVDMPTLAQIANRCRVLVESTRVQAKDNVLNVTISIGASLAAPDDSPASLVKRTDLSLYRSKARGRNCVTTDRDL